MVGRIIMNTLANAAALAFVAGLAAAALFGVSTGIATTIVAFVALSLVGGVGLVRPAAGLAPAPVALWARANRGSRRSAT